MSYTSDTPAVLVLEDGTTFPGQSFGATGTRFGQLVFTTAMTGYQEVLTEPASAQLMTVHTFPHIGNTGLNSTDAQSPQMWASGMVVAEPARIVSSHLAETTLEEGLVAAGVVGIRGVDTRAITTHLRNAGTQKAGIFTGDDAAAPVDELVQAVKDAQLRSTDQLLGEVGDPVEIAPAAGTKVAIINLGVRRATLEQLADRGFDFTVLPADATLDDIKATGATGVILSNGPGDPREATAQLDLAKALLNDGTPVLGIGLGHQLLALAAGLDVTALHHGHHGSNQPIKLVNAEGSLNATLNALYAVTLDADTATTAAGELTVTHRHLVDNTVEGFRIGNTAIAVSFHPEDAQITATEPHPIFDAFADITSTGHAS